MEESVENQFWLGLYYLAQQEDLRRDSSEPVEEQVMHMCERIGKQIVHSGDFYRVLGADHWEPLPQDPTLDFFIFGALLGNYLAWAAGVSFVEHRAKEN